MAEDLIPEKKYFKIGETSSLLGVKPHVLRYWETEFPQVRPFKSRTGQRLYRRQDVEALVKIQKLLYEERFTIAGAKQALRFGDVGESDIVTEPEPASIVMPVSLCTKLQDAKSKLESILECVA